MTPEELERLTFRNAVMNEQENLVRILNGEFASKIYTCHRRMYLRKHGILDTTRSGVKVRRAYPTERAIEVLDAA